VADFDVLIAGAGPAGCATALSLSAFAPELRVGLAGAGGDEERVVRIGETVPPQINPLLMHLGVWQEFSSDSHSRSYRTMAAWGDSRLASNEFLSHAHQVGWRLDRAAFDRMLVNFASSRIAAAFAARLVALAQEGRRWRASLSDGGIHTVDFIVDATGRGAAAARRCRLQPIAIDRLVGCCVRTGSRTDGTEGLLIESCAEGWWYTAALSDGDRVLVCMTDADRVRSLELSSARSFARLFAETDHMRRVADIGEPPPRPVIVCAVSRFVPASPGLPLLCVGEAALACDPLAGDGIVRALRSGIFASYAIADWLRRGDARGLARYRLMLRREFFTYREIRRDYYAREQRWPDSPFWRRRHGRCPSTDLSFADPARLRAT
jgi:2-polyprenyl-6-methoxyphenol hydroxylase-like FAD-dependent oxidoreductase